MSEPGNSPDLMSVLAEQEQAVKRNVVKPPESVRRRWIRAARHYRHLARVIFDIEAYTGVSGVSSKLEKQRSVF